MRILSQLSRRSARRKGLTLVEILVVSVIFSIIATSLFIVFKAGLDSWRRTQAHLDVYQNARAAIDMMTRELSAAYLNTANNTITFRGFALGAAAPAWANNTTADSVFFIASLNPSLNYNDAAFELCKVGYYLNANNELIKYFYYVKTGTAPIYDFSDNTNVVTQKIASNVTALTFRYFDAAGGPYTGWDSTSATSPPAQLNTKPSKVQITFTIQESATGKAQTVTAGVYIPQ